MALKVFGQIQTIDDVIAVASYLGSDFFSPDRLKAHGARTSTEVCIVDQTHGMFVMSTKREGSAKRDYQVYRYVVEDYARRAGRRTERFEVYPMGTYDSLYKAKTEMWALYAFMVDVAGFEVPVEDAKGVA